MRFCCDEERQPCGNDISVVAVKGWDVQTSLNPRDDNLDLFIGVQSETFRAPVSLPQLTRGSGSPAVEEGSFPCLRPPGQARIALICSRTKSMTGSGRL